nr:hypothetical protein Iba_chr04aCG22210 [Ipomoea batatas]
MASLMSSLCAEHGNGTINGADQPRLVIILLQISQRHSAAENAKMPNSKKQTKGQLFKAKNAQKPVLVSDSQFVEEVEEKKPKGKASLPQSSDLSPMMVSSKGKPRVRSPRRWRTAGVVNGVGNGLLVVVSLQWLATQRNGSLHWPVFQPNAPQLLRIPGTTAQFLSENQKTSLHQKIVFWEQPFHKRSSTLNYITSYLNLCYMDMAAGV